ncbi:lysophospholipid acyltransferase family protein [uncultured Megamonas sp.]|uniref:lysophospholipid acyltransferase family protein n=1 Tax=uncultured Megamonas sp. TaxID=286140 RepID=UPI0025D100B2|nr:lysophospholipid acyltransferase family protein [uncultured Megamonas sp.]
MLYGLLRILFTFIYSIIFPTTVKGKENVPKEGAVILAANHLSNWDPPLVGTFIPRHLAYMAKEELFKVPILKNILKAVHTFPVKRGASDRAAIKTALQMLKAKECICMFPEGTRSKDGKLHKGAPGVALIAAKSKATVVPVAIQGTFKLKPFRRITLIYGKPMVFEAEKVDKENLQEFTEKIMQEIASMLKIQ